MNASTYCRSLLSLTLLAAACTGDDKGGTDTETTTEATTEGSTSTDGSTSQGSTSVMSTTGMTTETGTSGMTEGTDSTASTDSDSSTSDGTTAGTTGVEDVCAPSEDVQFQFKLLPEPDYKPLELEWICKVLAIVDGDGGERSLEMSCDDLENVAIIPPPTLVITASPATELAQIKPGAALRVFYYQATPWWIERWLRVEDLLSGELLLAAIDGVQIDPNEMVKLTAPVELSAADGTCTPLKEDCGMVERLVLDGMAEGVMSAHLDGSFVIAGGDPGYSVWVEGAARFVGDIECTDTPERWYSLGVVADGQE